MKIFVKILFIAVFYFTEMPAYPSENSESIECINPGSILVVEDNSKKGNLFLNGITAPLPPVYTEANKRIFLIGIDLYSEKITYRIDKKEYIKNVCKIEFPVERLKLPPDRVFLKSEDIVRVEKEKDEMEGIWKNIDKDSYIDGDFILPVTGEVRENFGLRRIINGEPRSPHTGVDIIADEGNPVFAPNNGRIIYKKDTFFGGNSLIIEHGAGLYTIYFHLKDILKEKGELVKKGEVIGTVGKTGRASGPHLHWGARLLGARVNPLYLLDISKKTR